MGIYYTPPRAATLLARWAIRSATDVVLEPSFGGCSMLSAAAEEFRSFGVSEPSGQFVGYDVDPVALEHLARIGLKRTVGKFHLGDFLSRDPGDARVDAVLANPPFVAYHRMDQSQRERVMAWRDKYFCPINRRASLWAYFLLHAASFLKDGGRMAFLLPMALETADYAQPLLGHLRRTFRRIQVLNLSEQLFIQEGAEERVAIMLLDGYSSQPRAAGGDVSITRIRTIDDVQIAADFIVQAKGHETAIARARASLESATNAVRTLGEIARVDIGEVVGDMKFFVRSPEDWKALDIEPHHRVPLLTRTTQIEGLAVSRSQAISTLPQLLLPPVGYRAEALKKVLQVWTKKKVEAISTFRKRVEWYRCSYDINADAFFASLTHQYPRMIGNDAGISCANAFYKISLTSERHFSPWLPIIALSAPFRLAGELHGRVRGGGGMKLEPSDLRRLPVPLQVPDIATSASAISVIDSFARQGDFASASRMADEHLYELTGLIDRTKLAEMRRLCEELVRSRLRELRS